MEFQTEWENGISDWLRSKKNVIIHKFRCSQVEEGKEILNFLHSLSSDTYVNIMEQVRQNSPSRFFPTSWNSQVAKPYITFSSACSIGLTSKWGRENREPGVDSQSRQNRRFLNSKWYQPVTQTYAVESCSERGIQFDFSMCNTQNKKVVVWN